MFNKLAALGHFIGTWYVSTVLLAGVGLILGSAVFFFGYPGKPKIGIINIPFTVIDDRSAFEINAMIDYVREDGSIKGVVISLNSPDGHADPRADGHAGPDADTDPRADGYSGSDGHAGPSADDRHPGVRHGKG